MNKEKFSDDRTEGSLKELRSELTNYIQQKKLLKLLKLEPFTCSVHIDYNHFIICYEIIDDLLHIDIINPKTGYILYQNFYNKPSIFLEKILFFLNNAHKMQFDKLTSRLVFRKLLSEEDTKRMQSLLMLTPCCVCHEITNRRLPCAHCLCFVCYSYIIKDDRIKCPICRDEQEAEY